MAINFMPEQQPENRPRITVFGVGGAGGNAVNNMIDGKLEGVDFVVANTDAQSLFQSLCENQVRLGVSITQGLGAGAHADIGKVAAEEALNDIQSYLEGNNMVFIAAGMGGGTGTGAAPVIAHAAREHGILTVGVVTKPFHFEGSQRMRTAECGIQELHRYVDTLIVIPNQNLFHVASKETTFADAFDMADNVLHAGVRGVTDLMVNPGLINLDFADIRTVMGTMGKAMMGTGEAEGENRATEAVEAAINNPLLDNASIEGARGVLINVTGGTDVTLQEVEMVASRICKQADEEATIIFGTSLDQKMDGCMRVAVIATGIDSDEVRAPIPESADNIHVLGPFGHEGASGSGSTMSVGEPEKDAAEPVAAPRHAATGTDPSGLVIPEVEAVAESASAVSGGAQPAPAGSTVPRPSASPSSQPPTTLGGRARQEHRAVAASPAGGVVAGVRTPEKKPGLPPYRPASDHQRTERPAPSPHPAKDAGGSPRFKGAIPPPVDGGPRSWLQPGQTEAGAGAIQPPTIHPCGGPPPKGSERDRTPPLGKPSLFERMTGTGRARRNGGDGETPSTGTAPGTPVSSEVKSGGPQKSGPGVRLRSEPSSRPPSSPTLGGGTQKPIAPSPAPTLGGETGGTSAPAPGPLLDGFLPSSPAPGGTGDPLDIPKFLRRQTN